MPFYRVKDCQPPSGHGTSGLFTYPAESDSILKQPVAWISREKKGKTQGKAVDLVYTTHLVQSEKNHATAQISW